MVPVPDDDNDFIVIDELSLVLLSVLEELLKVDILADLVHPFLADSFFGLFHEGYRLQPVIAFLEVIG